MKRRLTSSALLIEALLAAVDQGAGPVHLMGAPSDTAVGSALELGADDSVCRRG